MTDTTAIIRETRDVVACWLENATIDHVTPEAVRRYNEERARGVFFRDGRSSPKLGRKSKDSMSKWTHKVVRKSRGTDGRWFAHRTHATGSLEECVASAAVLAAELATAGITGTRVVVLARKGGACVVEHRITATVNGVEHTTFRPDLRVQFEIAASS